MKFTITLLLILAFSPLAYAANGTIQGFCADGGKKVSVSGLNSTTTVQQSFPACTVNVYLTGTSTHATIYSNAGSTVLANPFTANADGKFLFYAVGNAGLDVVISGGTSPNTLPSPLPILVNVFPSVPNGGGAGCTTDCVVTDPTGSQPVIQPANTIFTVTGQDSDAGTTAEFSVATSSGSAGVSQVSVSSLGSATMSTGASSSNVSALTSVTGGQIVNNTVRGSFLALGTGTNPYDNYTLQIGGPNASAYGSTNDVGSSFGWANNDDSQSAIMALALGKVQFGASTGTYSFGNRSSLATAKLVNFDFSGITTDHTVTVPEITGELGVIAGTPTGGNCVKFDSTGKWLIDSGSTCGGGSSLPSGTANQMLYYASSGTTVTPLTLGTNLSITGGVLNASSTASTAFSAITTSTNTTATMTVGSGASVVPTGTGVITPSNVTGLVTPGTNVTITGSGTIASPYVVNSSGGGGGGGTVFCAVNPQTGTTYTAVLTDGTSSGSACIGTVTMTNAATNTVTIPPNSSVAFPVPDEIDFIQLGAGQTTIAAGAGVTLITPTSLSARAQNSTFGIRQIATNTWVVFGDTQ